MILSIFVLTWLAVLCIGLPIFLEWLGLGTHRE